MLSLINNISLDSGVSTKNSPRKEDDDDMLRYKIILKMWKIIQSFLFQTKQNKITSYFEFNYKTLPNYHTYLH